MQVYIFRILAEEEEAFLREIALSEDNTLLDFHVALTRSMGLNDKLLASFYLTDKQWEKQQEFTLTDMDVDAYTGERENEGAVPIDVMSNAYIGDVIEDPKQRMLYEYNFFNPTLFFISLIEKKEEGDDNAFPKILRSEGNIDVAQTAAFDDDMDDDMMEDGYDEDDLRDFGFDSDDDDYDDEYHGSDSFGSDDF
ncbi:MAG: plasmid pRiA4b ORF-3 family protein [Bacteroidales bacterium]|nr:plasmid pRiA4b ORF-3 family protein [Bacteroidales bacterium]